MIEVFPLMDTGDEDDEEDVDEVEPDEVFAGPARGRPALGAFVQRAALVIEAGRPDCPFCGSPIDPEGHLCVRGQRLPAPRPGAE